MVRQKGGGNPPPPPASGELGNLEFDFLVLRDETTAKIGEIQSSLVDFRTQLRAELLEEFRQLRLATSTQEGIRDQTSLQFGTVPSPIRPSLSGDTTSSTAVVSEGNKSSNLNHTSLNLAHHEVILGYTSEINAGSVDVTTAMISSDVVVSRANSREDLRGLMSESMPQMKSKEVMGGTSGGSVNGMQTYHAFTQPTHYFQHSNFGSQPFNACTGPLHSHNNQVQPLYNHVPLSGNNPLDPFIMTYTGPYSAPASFPCHASLPFAVPAYLHSHGFNQGNSGAPIYATTTTPVQQQPYFQPLHAPAYSHGQQVPYVDLNLPTMRQMKLDFNVFSGGDPVEWLNKADQYFELYQIPEERKLSIATMHLADKASDRWHMFRHEFPNTWYGLADLLMREFAGYNKADYQASLAKMSQTGSVEQYVEQFTKLSRRAPGFSQDLLLSCFIGGLKDDIRIDVKSQKPRTLYEACELAKVFEERYVRPRNSRSASTHFGDSRQTSHYSNIRSNHSTTTMGGSKFNGSTGGSGNSNNNRRLSQSEYQERRARNQCFFCDETFKPGHNCRKGQAMMMLEVTLDESDPKINLVDEPMEVPPVHDCEEPLIQLHVLADHSNAVTMQLKGLFNNKMVHVLIDSGATHNFIHPTLLKNLKAQVHNLTPLNVQLASGAKMQTMGEVYHLLQLQKFEFNADFYVLPISGCEVVLGASWLRTLGDILWNFDKLLMKFTVEGAAYQLQGELDPQTSMVSCKAMKRLLRKEKEAMMVQVVPVANPSELEKVPSQITTLINKYKDIFQSPTTLPPAREQDHKIELMPNTSPVSVRPYRYPYFQKTEIEKIVQELLDNGVIRPSVSPFSSPVLLVKKKDGTWRMCIDYRALNSVTVKDKYPIPVVDELLDETYGSTIFTKLDLRSGYHQIRMSPADINKTAFRTHSGHYEFLVMPFGLTNAPSTFQSVMNDVLRDFLRKFVLVFFDDILVYSSSLDVHVVHLEQVFNRLQLHSLKVKESKCSFGVPQVEYLGHVISARGVV